MIISYFNRKNLKVLGRYKYSKNYPKNWKIISGDMVIEQHTTFISRTHLSKIMPQLVYGDYSRDLLLKKRLRSSYSLPLNLELAPIETVFALIKLKIRINMNKVKLSFHKSKGKWKIIYAKSMISTETIYKILLRVVRITKEYFLMNQTLDTLNIVISYKLFKYHKVCNYFTLRYFER